MNNKIKEARITIGLTQQQVSDKLGIPKRTIESWEAGRGPRAKWLIPWIVEKIETLKK